MAQGGRPIVLNHSFFKGQEVRGVTQICPENCHAGHAQFRQKENGQICDLDFDAVSLRNYKTVARQKIAQSKAFIFQKCKSFQVMPGFP